MFLQLLLITNFVIANTNYDPNNSVNMNDLRNSLNNNFDSAMSSSPSLYPVTDDPLARNTIVQPDYDQTNSVQFNHSANSFSASADSDRGPATSINDFLAAQERLQSNLLPMASPNENNNDYDSQNGIQSQSVYQQFIPKQLSGQTKEPSLISTPQSFSDINLNLKNAEQLNEDETVDSKQLKPFYNQSNTLD